MQNANNLGIDGNKQIIISIKGAKLIQYLRICFRECGARVVRGHVVSVVRIGLFNC